MILIILLISISLVFVYSACKVSGMCSQKEEMEKITKSIKK